LCRKVEGILASQSYGNGEEGIGLVPGKWEFKIPRRMTLYGRCAGG
jgi:hypothetical protein